MVRSELLEIAALLERASCPAPAAVSELDALLGNGCDSPLYNPRIHESELRAALYYTRRALLDPQPHPPGHSDFPQSTAWPGRADATTRDRPDTTPRL
jgi:hypothetical protein